MEQESTAKRKRGRPAKTPLDYRKELFSNTRYERLYTLLPKYEVTTYGNVLKAVKLTGINGNEKASPFASKFFDLAIRADLMIFSMIKVKSDDGGMDVVFGSYFVEFRLVPVKGMSRNYNQPLLNKHN